MAYQPRLDKTGIYNNANWYSGTNLFYPQAQLPNCTCYAYGRWLELNYPVNGIAWTAPDPTKSGNAEYWYPATLNKGVLTCGTTPALGAIACWARGDGNRGHVGVVEAIDPNGDLLVSMSGYQRPITSPVYDMRKFFWLEREPAATGYRSDWMINSDPMQQYNLQGFIYPPNAETLEWMWEVTDNYPTMPASYKQNNARLIYGVLQSMGWRLEPICAVLGNMENEGILNPGQCELGRGIPLYDTTTGIPTNVYFLPDQSHNYGLGLCGWTQAPNALLSRSVSQNVPWYDGTLQCELLNDAALMGFWIPTSQWPDSFADFKINAANRSVADLASAFLWEYERPAAATAHEAERRAQAEYWYNYLLTAGPVNPPFEPGAPQGPLRRMPIWMMIRYH